MSLKSIVDVGKRLFLSIQQDECTGLAAEMAYNFMLALFPTLIFLFSLFGLIGSSQNLFPEMLAFFYRITPPDVAALLKATLAEIFQGSSGQLAILSLMGALWAASNGAVVVMKGLNRAYKVPEHHQAPFWRERIKAVLVTLSLAFLLLIGSNLLLFGDMLIAWAVDYFAVNDRLLVLIHWLRWLLIVTGVIFMTAVIYAIAPQNPDGRIHWRASLPGATAFILLWFGISKMFSFYVENMARYNQVYGALGVVVILMVWLYLTSLVLLIGGEINSLASNAATDETAPAQLKPGSI